MEIETHNNHCVFSEKIQRCQDYMQALEQERRKILVFQRELPLCLHLVTQAIESCEQQLSECSEQTSSDDDSPVLEEFIPIIIKRASSHSDCEEEEQQSKKSKIDDKTIEGQNGNNNNNDKNIKKSDWLRSVQLWNQSPDPPSNQDDSPKKVEMKKSGYGGAFHPFKKDENVAPPVENPVPPVSTTSTAGTGGGNKKEELNDGQSRKARRCWSSELHKKFLQALQQLGGSHIATPKQIRELMKVNGLTNDEVKSHLQKYRLHTRRSSPSKQHTTNAQAPQFVMVTGGLWMLPEYTSAMATTTTKSGDVASTGIYAPITSLPTPFGETSKKSQPKTSDFNDRNNHNEHRVRLSSPATSSSTHTTSVY